MSKVNLPFHWKSVQLKDIVSILGDGLHGTPSYAESGTYFFINGNNLSHGKIQIKNTTKRVDCSEYEKYKKPLNDRSILVSINGTLGNVAFYNNENVILGKSACYFNLLNHIDKNYIGLLLSGQCFLNYATKVATGSTIKNVSLKSMREFELALPPLIEQTAIVSKIEELFSELDKGIENLKTAQQQLKIYRQSVLKWAFEGRLTNKNNWKNVKLDEIAKAIDPQPSHRTPPIVQNGIPFVSIKDFDSDIDKIDFTNARKVSPEVLKEHLNRYTLEIGDFVIGKIGTIGKPVRLVLPQDYCLSANIVLIQPRKINSTYLYYFFQSSLIEKAFSAGTKSTTQAAFGIQKVRELRIELPNGEEQEKVVQEIESRLSVADKMEESINQSLQQAEALRQSILKKAFEGKLLTEGIVLN